MGCGIYFRRSWDLEEVNSCLLLYVDEGEAKAYLENDILRNRLLEISNALLDIESGDPVKVMGFPDNLKLQSCMTLFQAVAPEETVFQKVLDKFFDGESDKKTIKILRDQRL